jgi:hypothetical protein
MKYLQYYDIYEYIFPQSSALLFIIVGLYSNRIMN